MEKLLIKNGKVWNGDKFLNADVLIEHGTISAISEHINADAHFVFDATGKIVSAGLVDAHMHLRGISSEVFGAPVQAACFPFGVTAAADASVVHSNGHLPDSFMVKTGVFVCSAIDNNTADFTNTRKMMKEYEERVVGIKVCYDTSVNRISDIRPLKQICNFARENGLIVMVHCSNSPVAINEITNVLGKGDILTHAYQGSENNVSVGDFESIVNAKERGVYVDCAMAGNVHIDFGIYQNAIMRNLVPDIISTDLTKLSLNTRGGRYGMTMCMSISKKLGMNEENIFRAVTSNPAKALRRENEWGYLKEGRCADIAVFDYTDEGFDLTDKYGNNVQGNLGFRCVLTICDGQVVYRR